MEVAVVQYDIAWEDKPSNHARIEEMLQEAEVPSGAFVLLPELGDTGFSYDLEAIITVPRSEFPSDAEIVPGDIVPIHLVPESADEEGGDLEARVIKINPEAIVLDAKHPWAGQDIHFEIEIVSVDPGDDS